MVYVYSLSLSLSLAKYRVVESSSTRVMIRHLLYDLCCIGVLTVQTGVVPVGQMTL